MRTFLWISLGAIVGANVRYLAGRSMAQWLGTGFPYGTFLVNVGGSFLMGLVGTLVASRLIARPEVVRLVVMVGFLGSMTTFSSLTFESYGLFNDGAWMRALTNLFLSLFAGMAGIRLGAELALRMGGMP